MVASQIKGPVLGVRHLQAFLIFLNIVVIYTSRFNIAVAVVAMTNSETTNPDFPEYNWEEKHKQIIISSFYWGYVVTQFPGGYWARRYGVKCTMLFSTFGSAVFCLIVPFCVPWGGWQIFCVLRIFQGCFQGTIFPCMHDHLAKWSPPEERTFLGAISHTGVECGNMLAMFTGGYIAASPLGWPGISYITAGMCFVWCVLWLTFAANNATESRFITAEERIYVESSLQHSDGFHKTKIPVPWRAILTSAPFYALLYVRCAQGWGSSTIQAELPMYLNGVFNMDMKDNALYSTLPFLAMWFMSYVYLVIANFVLKKKLLTLTSLRKTFNSISLWIPAVGLIGIGFLGRDQKGLAIALMIISVAFNSGNIIGSALATIDLSPNHVSILMGIVNCIANFILVLTPLVTAAIVTNEHDRTQWHTVFVISAVVFFTGDIVYLIFGSCETQAWNSLNYLQTTDKDKHVVEDKQKVNSVERTEGIQNQHSRST